MQTVAVIGASSNRSKFGNKAVRGFKRAGYRVVPIHLNASEIEGLKVYRSVLDVPFDIDIATIYVPPETGARIIEELALKNIPEIWINPGAESPTVIRRAKEVGLQTIVGCSLIAIGQSP